MLYLYDSAIVKDLQRAFNPDNVSDLVVKVVDPDGILTLAAQIQDDAIKLPVVAVYREPDTPIDRSRWNFTRAKIGIPVVFENDKNNIYYEKAVPIELNYKLTVLTHNTADLDELVRELVFKYSDQFFMQLTVPYESKRIIRFGVVVDPDKTIERTSGSFEYMQSGALHQAIIPLKVLGAVLITYTPRQLKNVDYEIEAK